MNQESEIANYLSRVGSLPDSEIDIGETALALAAIDLPGVSLARYREHLAMIAEAPGSRPSDTAADQAEALRWAIHDRFGYEGDALTYDDPDNANLMRVIDRRKGLPVALGILYIHAGRHQGWLVNGLAFPGHFLVAVTAGRDRLVLDPFTGGQRLDVPALRQLTKKIMGENATLRAEYTANVGSRNVLLRLQNNMKTRALTARKPQRAVEVLKSMVTIAPDEAALWNELGAVEAELGQLQGARQAFETVLRLDPAKDLREEALRQIEALRRRLN
jgi:regulator of sirC expression with transglutaminase-like and TPR domain